MTTLVGLAVVLCVILMVLMFVDGCICIAEEYCFNVFDKISVGFVLLVIAGTLMLIAHKVGELVMKEVLK